MAEASLQDQLNIQHAEISGLDALLVALVQSHPNIRRVREQFETEAGRRVFRAHTAGAHESYMDLLKAVLENHRELLRRSGAPD